MGIIDIVNEKILQCGYGKLEFKKADIGEFEIAFDTISGGPFEDYSLRLVFRHPVIFHMPQIVEGDFKIRNGSVADAKRLVPVINYDESEYNNYLNIYLFEVNNDLTDYYIVAENMIAEEVKYLQQPNE